MIKPILTKTPKVELIRVEAEKLLLNDEFMKYTPQDENQEECKALITEAISKKVKDFCRFNCDPCFSYDRKRICFIPGSYPAVGKSYNWNEQIAKEYMPELNSRLGTKLQYAAFLGVLIKELSNTGFWTIEKAWNAVCNNSSELGYYSKDTNIFHRTGIDHIFNLYDLANTYKILAPDEGKDGHWLASGGVGILHEPIAHFRYCAGRDDLLYFSTAWIVADV